jgi:hypothetical protein
MQIARTIFRRARCFRTSDIRSLPAADRHKKPCRINIQFATNRTVAQPRARDWTDERACGEGARR